MNCPGCGAAMRVAANRRHFHCEHCGNAVLLDETPEGVTVLEEPAGADCPVCQLPLQAAYIEAEAVGYCTRCRGFLAPTPIFGQIVTKLRARHAPHEHRPERFDPAELKRTLKCPGCRRRMETHPYAGGGNVVVDSCGRCNVIWLDAGELALIGRYVPRPHQIEPVLQPAAESPPEPSLSDLLDIV